MMSIVTPEIRAFAEIYTGDAGRQKAKSLLREFFLPDGLLPVKDVEELVYVKETGFCYIKQKNDIVQRFEKAGKQVSYATELFSYFENYKLRKVSGVKVKEMIFWIPLTEIYVDSQTSDKLTVKTPIGISKSFNKEYFEA